MSLQAPSRSPPGAGPINKRSVERGTVKSPQRFAQVFSKKYWDPPWPPKKRNPGSSPGSSPPPFAYREKIIREHQGRRNLSLPSNCRAPRKTSKYQSFKSTGAGPHRFRLSSPLPPGCGVPIDRAQCRGEGGEESSEIASGFLKKAQSGSGHEGPRLRYNPHGFPLQAWRSLPVVRGWQGPFFAGSRNPDA